VLIDMYVKYACMYEYDMYVGVIEKEIAHF